LAPARGCFSPRRFRVEIAVGRAENSPDLLKSPAEIQAVEVFLKRGGGCHGGFPQRSISSFFRAARRDAAPKMPVDQREGPAQEVPVVIGKVRVEPVDQGGFAEVTVRPKGNFSQEEVS